MNLSLVNPMSNRRAPRNGFTLNELLIVIALLVLAVGLAIPAFNAIARSSNVESSVNQISAYFADARAQAVGLQKPRGVIVFKDQATSRLVMAQIHYPEDRTFPQIELYGGRDEMMLPQGIALRSVPSNSATTLTSQYENWQPYLVVMFDGNGKLLFDRINLQTNTNLFRRLAAFSTPAAGTIPPTTDTFSHFGFILYEESAFNAQPNAGTTRRDWLRENGVPFIVNRYNGSLMKGE